MRLLLLCVLSLLAGSVAAAPLDGTWQLDTAQGTFTARLVTQGRAVIGTIDVAGRSTISLTGTLQGDAAAGLASTDEGVGRFEARVQGDALELVLSQEDGPNQRAARLPLSFRRVQAAAPPVPGGKPAPAAGDAGGDGRLVGTWEWQEVISSGGASFAQSEWLVIRADGTFAWNKGAAAAGGAGWSYDGGSGGDGMRGRWRARGGVLFAQGADGAWMRVGTYGMTDDGAAMRISYDGGDRRIWQRR